MKNPNNHGQANAGALNAKIKAIVAQHNNDPHFKSDAQVMLYGNQDEVAMLIGRRGVYDKWVNSINGGGWHQWTGAYWQRDEKAGAFDVTRKGIRDAIARMNDWVELQVLIGSLSEEEEEDLVQAAFRADKTKRDKRYISDIYMLLSKDDQCTATPSQFNADKHLLGTPKFEVDLREPKPIAANPQDYISKQTVCTPEEGDPVLWLHFLYTIFDGDQEVIDFIQRLCGYALTGSAAEEHLFFLYGSGANGKSKFIETLMYIWKDYAVRIAPKTLLNTNFSEHPTEIAKLAGARLVLGSELPVGEVWDDQKLKEITGGDTLTGRFMRQDYFDFEPQHTLVIAGNHIPKMKHVGEAERRRFVLIPFNVTIPMAQRDPKLGDKLKDEAGQILTWCIKGSGMYHKSGLQIPQSILDASKEYLDAEDVVGEFLKTQLTPVGGKEVELDQLSLAANDWFNANNHSQSIDRKALKKELMDRGNDIRRSGSKYYLKDHDLVA